MLSGTAAPTITGMGIDLDANRVRQLGVRGGELLVALNAPAGFAEGLRRAADDSVRVVTSLPAGEQADVIIFWSEEAPELEAQFRRLRLAVRPDGAIWAVLRKKGAARERPTSPDWNEVQRAGLSAGLVDNKTLSLSGEEYGTRFVVPLRERPQASRRAQSRR